MVAHNKKAHIIVRFQNRVNCPWRQNFKVIPEQIFNSGSIAYITKKVIPEFVLMSTIELNTKNYQ